MTLPLDMLKRPIKVGDTVLCKGYGSCSHNTFTTVLRVNPKSVTISNSYHAWDRDSAGKWVYKPSTKTQTRAFSDVLVVSELLPISESLAQQFVVEHPEHFL